MSKNLIKTAYYPRNTSLQEALAAKIITRVVSDGISLRNAVREAIKVAELNKKDIFLVMSVLQDFGMVQNGDFKNYWSNGWGEGVGTEGLDTNQGTNYYASQKGKVVTADDKRNFELFDQVDKLRAFATDEEIISVNPELELVIASMNTAQNVITALGADDGFDIPETFFQKAFKKAIEIYKQREQAGVKKPFEEIFHKVAGKGFENINWSSLEPLIKKYIPDYSPLFHVEPKGLNPVGASMKTAIWTGDAGDEHEDQNHEDEINDLEESFGLAGVPYPKRHEASFVGVVIAALGTKISQEELSFLQKTLQKAIESYKKNNGNIPLEDIFHNVSDSHFPNIDWHKLEPMIQKYIPEYRALEHDQHGPIIASVRTAQDAGVGLESLPAEANAPAEATAPVPDLTVEEPETGAEDLTVEESDDMGGEAGEVKVEVTPSPSELMQMAKEGPQWEIKNMLSINKAEEYYNQLKKELEAVVFNPNIKIDLNGIEKYDKVRNMIDGELNKIKEATKGKEKLEKKEEKLEEELTNPEINIEEGVGDSSERAITPGGIEEAEPTKQGI